MYKILIVLVLLTGCSDGAVICASDGRLFKKESMDSVRRLQTPNQICSINQDGSITIRNK